MIESRGASRRGKSHPARLAPMSANAVPRDDIAIMPLEPRIMMDAALDLGLDSYFSTALGNDTAGALADLLDMASNISTQFGSLSDLLAGELGTSLGDAAALFAGAGDNPYELGSSNAIEEAFATIRSLGSAIADSILEDVSGDILAAMDAVKTKMESEFRSVTSTYFSGLTSEQHQSVFDLVDASIAEFGLDTLFDGTAAFISLLSSAEDQAVTAASAASTSPGQGHDFFTDAQRDAMAQQLRNAFVGAIAEEISDTVSAIDTSIMLKDVEVNGQKVIEFASVSGGAVKATLDFGAMLPDFSALFDSFGFSADTVTSWSDLLADLGDVAFSFEISAQTAGASTTITLDNFETNLLSFGGAFDPEYYEDLKFTAGMFSAEVTAIGLALFEIGFGGPITVSFNSSDFVTSLDGPSGGFLNLMITEAGGSVAQVFDADAQYSFARVEFAAGLDWGLDAVFSDLDDDIPASFRVDGQFALVGGGSTLAVVADAAVKALDGNGIEITPSAENQERLDALTETVLGMARLDGSALLDALASAVSGLDVVLSSNIFDINLPLIGDFDLSALTRVYQTVSGLLLKPMEVDIGVLGLTKGTDTAINGSLVIEGILADSETGRIFADRGGETLAFTLSAKSGTVSQVFTLSVDVPEGGFATARAYADALKAAAGAVDASAFQAGKTLANLIAINEVRGEIELRSSVLKEFSIGGDAAVLALLGVASANDTARSGAPLSGIDLTGILDQGWLALFQLNLDIERTVTYEDGQGNTTTETVTYRTLTLSPENGGWTLPSLVGQINDFFTAASIAMEASDNGAGGIAFTVDDTAAATAYAKSGHTVTDTAFTFAIDGANASIAASVDVLQAYINESLSGIIPGAELDIDIGSGQVVLRFPEIAFGVETAFQADLAASLGPLAEIDIEAAFALAAKFMLGFGVGADLKGLYNADSDASVSEFIFLEDVLFEAEVSAIADNISGTGRLGIVEVEVGGTGVNQVAIGAKFSVGLIGQDADTGDYTTRVNVSDFITTANSAAGIASLLGVFDLVGTVDTGDGDAFALISLNDVRVGLSGINIGIEDDAIESVTASLSSIFAPTDWSLDIDSPIVNLIAGLGTDDFIDTLYNSLILVDQLLNGLAQDMAFLGTEIPVLGVSVLDIMDFAKDLADQLRTFSASPNEGLSEISASLASAFGLGADDLHLVWDSGESVFYVSLGLDFIDAPLEYDFSLDLAELLGSMAGSDSAVANILSVASSLGNVTGDGRIVLDASLGFDLTFGIDLASLVNTIVPVTPMTALAAMTGISQLSYNTTNSGHGGRDVMISVARAGSGAPEYIDIKIELDDAATVGEAIGTIFDRIAAAGHGDDIAIEIVGKNGLGEDVRILIDGTNKALDDFGVDGLEISSIGFIDTGATPLNFSGADPLFGASAPVDVEDDGGVLKLTGVDLNSIDTAAAYAFGLVVNGAGPFAISIAADAGRDADGLVEAVQAALSATLVSRADVGLGLPSNIRLDKLVSAGLSADGELELTVSNFAQTIGKDQIALTLTGVATGETSTVTVRDLDGSNIARALGFVAVDGVPATADTHLHGAVLEARNDSDTGVSAFIVTEDIVVNGNIDLAGTGIRLEFIAGVPDGLNMALALGPLSVSVVDGVAVIGDGNGGNAFVQFGIDDAVDAYLGHGDAADGRVYLSAIGDIFTGMAPAGTSIGDLFSFDAKVALELILPLEDSLGLLEAVEDAGVSITGDLFRAEGSFSNASGALVALFGDGEVSDYLDIQINLPSFDEILENLNPWAIINDPILLTNGLDMILSAIDKTLRSVIRAMDLPIVGDAMTQGLTVFNDIAYSILRPIQEAANTPNADGSMPTTIDLIERVVNDALKSLFGIEDDVIRAVLTEDQNNPSIVAEIFLDGFTIFEAALDVGFDLGIPGLNLQVGQNSALLFEIIADINIAFGIDKNGFFFLNDTDAAEIAIEALVRTSDGFVASASLGLVGMALTANEIEDHGFGGDIKGAVIGGRIEIDLFTSLGSAIADGQFDSEVSGYGKGNGYENIVRLNELSSSKSSTGEGSKMVSISGVFEVHVDLHLTTSVINPSTGAAINELPSAIADFVFDARYEIGGELEMIRLEFQDVGLYAGDFLAENLMPVLQEINKYVSPIADMVQFLKDTGIGDFSVYDLIYEITRYTYPAALFVFEAVDTIVSVIEFIEDLGDDATVYFGSFSLLTPSTASGVVDTTNSKALANLRPGTSVSHSSSLVMEGAITNNKPGISFDLLLFTDVSNVLNLITGNLGEVELFEIDLTLLDFTLNIDLVGAIKSAVSFLPGAVVDALFGGFHASFYIHAEAGITVGYDLYGIAEFLGSGNAADILDGMYFDADRPLLAIDASFNVGIGINLAVIKAGMNLSGYFGLEISMNDPNQDGKLRFGELVWVIQEYSVFHLFEGDIKLGLEFGVYFKLDFFFFSVGGSWNWTLLDFSAHFGHDFTANPYFFDTQGNVTTLNVGATAGSQIGGSAVDGDDTIEFNGNRVYINGRDAGVISGDTVLIYAGQGDNVIDVSGLSAGISFQIITGDGDDTIIVGNSSGLISTGKGNDKVLSAANASALNFAAFGLAGFGAMTSSSSTVASPAPTMPTGTAPTSYGAVRDRLPTTTDQELLILSSGGATIDMSDSTLNMIVVATTLDILDGNGDRVTLADWVAAEYQGRTVDMAEVRAKIDRALLTYTADGQTRADSGNSIIRTGTGNDIIIAGNGDDTIIDAGGSNIILAGDGDDYIELGGSGDNWVEAGAGSDLVIGSEGDDTIMGWGRYDATTTSEEYEEALAHMTPAERSAFAALVRTLLADDGSDWIEGNGGNDVIVGNGGGRNILIGGDGDDVIVSGTGHDILAGGDITITDAKGLVIDQQPGFNPIGKFVIRAELGADGDDHLYGGTGNNVLIGGGGDDWLEGVSGRNVLIGDFAEITMSGSSTILSVNSLHIHAGEQGDDTIQGGALADVAIGGGGQDRISAGNGRNVVVGDNAQITSTNMFEGVTKLVSLLGSEDDADSIWSGINTSIIVAGGSRQSYGDFISTGHFYTAPTSSAVQGDIIFADYGDLEGSLKAPFTLTTTFDAGDNDNVETTSGNDIIFAGAGDDYVSSGDGDDIVFGDVGTYRLDRIGRETVTLSTEHDSLANPEPGQTGDARTLSGEDTIVSGNGNNVLFGGLGNDTLTTGDGDDLVLGDNGTVLYGVAGTNLGRLHAEGRDTDLGGRDDIVTGAGDDVILGGGDGDRIDAGAGNDIAIGDWAQVDFIARTLQTQSPQHGDSDLIAGGDGDDIIIGGAGDDQISGGGDANVLIGDYASLTWTDRFALATITLDAIEHFGDDLIYSNRDPGFGSGTNADGNSIIVGGRGNDILHGGDAKDLVMGDWAIFTFLSPQDYPGLVAFDRLVAAESTENWVSGNDKLYGNGGRDILIAGDGNDLIMGGDAQDLIAGDAAIYVNYHDGWELLETRYPFDGGDDVIDGGPGGDIIVSGFFNFGQPGAGDFLYGNTIEDFMMGTSGSVLIHNGQVIRFNYLGLETKELISSNQLGASAGVLMRPVSLEPGMFQFLTLDDQLSSRFERIAPFDPDMEVSRQDAPLVLQFDTVMRQVLLGDEIVELLHAYRQGTISVDDFEDTIRDAVLAILTDRYGQNVPSRLIEMLERYIELLLAQFDDQNEQAADADLSAPDTQSSPTPNGG